ncbi:hypothetical protein NEHOM01_1700 [Nematocida homosporus]|uniref:uncharacterized protein n=1 Tax=Nematocida homosporus TaxID=1912981 RepID=UPI00221F38CB|nr:uncharacterized protein NEHOM01_1700 [Nematocida homosporus]KAI5186780.1 hypothetical protein NEHOM01_1700 [Nematocida homosporus]
MEHILYSKRSRQISNLWTFWVLFGALLTFLGDTKASYPSFKSIQCRNGAHLALFSSERTTVDEGNTRITITLQLDQQVKAVQNIHRLACIEVMLSLVIRSVTKHYATPNLMRLFKTVAKVAYVCEESRIKIGFSLDSSGCLECTLKCLFEILEFGFSTASFEKATALLFDSTNLDPCETKHHLQLISEKYDLFGRSAAMTRINDNMRVSLKEIKSLWEYITQPSNTHITICHDGFMTKLATLAQAAIEPTIVRPPIMQWPFQDSIVLLENILIPNSSNPANYANPILMYNSPQASTVFSINMPVFPDGDRSTVKKHLALICFLLNLDCPGSLLATLGTDHNIRGGHARPLVLGHTTYISMDFVLTSDAQLIKAFHTISTQLKCYLVQLHRWMGFDSLALETSPSRNRLSDLTLINTEICKRIEASSNQMKGNWFERITSTTTIPPVTCDINSLHYMLKWLIESWRWKRYCQEPIDQTQEHEVYPAYNIRYRLVKEDTLAMSSFSTLGAALKGLSLYTWPYENKVDFINLLKQTEFGASYMQSYISTVYPAINLAIQRIDFLKSAAGKPTFYIALYPAFFTSLDMYISAVGWILVHIERTKTTRFKSNVRLWTNETTRLILTFEGAAEAIKKDLIGFFTEYHHPTESNSNQILSPSIKAAGAKHFLHKYANPVASDIKYAVLAILGQPIIHPQFCLTHIEKARETSFGYVPLKCARIQLIAHNCWAANLDVLLNDSSIYQSAETPTPTEPLASQSLFNPNAEYWTCSLQFNPSQMYQSFVLATFLRYLIKTRILSRARSTLAFDPSIEIDISTVPGIVQLTIMRPKKTDSDLKTPKDLVTEAANEALYLTNSMFESYKQSLLLQTPILELTKSLVPEQVSEYWELYWDNPFFVSDLYYFCDQLTPIDFYNFAITAAGNLYLYDSPQQAEETAQTNCSTQARPMLFQMG